VTPRESVLVRGLVDWVALDRVHADVAEANEGAALSVVQGYTVELIRSLVHEQLFELGDVADNDGFTRWDNLIDESISRITDVYVANFDDRNVWSWFCWLNLTDKGELVAQDIKASRPPAGIHVCEAGGRYECV
jgi:hypothetical protein